MFEDDGSSSSVTSSSSPLQFFSMMSLSSGVGPPYTWLRELKPEERGLYLIHLLLTCGDHVAAGSIENAEICLGQISQLASPEGDTMQRIAAYFSEAFAHRIIKALPGVHRALNATNTAFVSDEILVRKLFFNMFPFLKLGFVLTNQAIIEAMEGEKMVHIIDLNAAEPTQWLALIQALSARPEGQPHLRITGIHQQKEVLDQMAHKLSEEAERLDIPFQFNPIVSKLENVDIEKFRVKTGEALAISSFLQLHSLLASDDELRKRSPLTLKNLNAMNLQRVLQTNQANLGEFLEKDTVANGYSQRYDSVSSSPLSSTASLKMDYFLNTLWSLSPKLMVVMEQDSNHNGSILMERLLEALYSYAALFDCLESTTPSKSSAERLKVEKMLFGEEIKNIISCEGAERKERHEKLEKWIQRFTSTGFGNVSLSYCGILQARRFLQGYGCDGYRIKEENGCVVICWQDRPLFSLSAWRCRK